MNDMISRAAAIDAFGECPYNWEDWPEEIQAVNDWEDAIEKIKNVPAVDATPVVHGRWITNKYGEIVCSECDNNALQVLTGCLVNRHFESHKSKYCPNCGAKMDGEM